MTHEYQHIDGIRDDRSRAGVSRGTEPNPVLPLRDADLAGGLGTLAGTPRQLTAIEAVAAVTNLQAFQDGAARWCASMKAAGLGQDTFIYSRQFWLQTRGRKNV